MGGTIASTGQARTHARTQAVRLVPGKQHQKQQPGGGRKQETRKEDARRRRRWGYLGFVCSDERKCPVLSGSSVGKSAAVGSRTWLEDLPRTIR